MPLTERFQKIDPGAKVKLGAIHAGAKVKLGAVNVGAKPLCHLADDAELTLTWQYLVKVLCLVLIISDNA
jgi:hypothetical protein